jgi:hypothetical protein
VTLSTDHITAVLLVFCTLAVNCAVAPAAMLTAVGDTATDIIATVSEAVPLIPLSEAVTLVAPEATPVTSPLELTFASSWLVVCHEAAVLTSAVDPSLYLAAAANCWVAPT